MGSFGEDLWDRFGKVGLADLPDDVVQSGKQCLLDWLGCAIAGSGQLLAELLRAEVQPGPGRASVLGAKDGADARSAALLNGAAGHALDYDDTNRIGGLHMTAPIAPAALAVAQANEASGADLLVAFVVGAEIACRYGAAISRSHYERGWHSTSVVGPFGGAASVARLYGLDTESFGRTVGLAASQACGVQANFGTMTKPFHAGKAAEAGVLAAGLARRGYGANPAAFEGFRGLVEAASDDPADLTPIDDWAIPVTLFKFHASCHGSHASIECGTALRGDLRPDEVERVEIAVHSNIYHVCRVLQPSTDLQTKFCLPVTFAAGLLGLDTSSPETFTLALLENPELERLRSVATVHEDDSLSPTGSTVTVVTADGPRSVTRDIADAEIDLTQQGVALRAKFLQLVEPVLGGAAAELADRVERLEELADLDDLARLLRP